MEVTVDRQASVGHVFGCEEKAIHNCLPCTPMSASPTPWTREGRSGSEGSRDKTEILGG